MVKSGHKDSVEQHSVCSKTCPNLSPFAPLFHGTVGTPSCSLSGEAGRDRTPSCNTTQLYIESRHSKCIESIKKQFYNISPIPGSLHLVLAYPDAEIAPKISQWHKSPELLFFPSYHHFRPP
jgi:hypothetical protein